MFISKFLVWLRCSSRQFVCEPKSTTSTPSSSTSSSFVMLQSPSSRTSSDSPICFVLLVSLFNKQSKESSDSFSIMVKGNLGLNLSFRGLPSDVLLRTMSGRGILLLLKALGLTLDLRVSFRGLLSEILLRMMAGKRVELLLKALGTLEVGLSKALRFPFSGIPLDIPIEFFVIFPIFMAASDTLLVRLDPRRAGFLWFSKVPCFW
mmetsp:Transcript_46082/g.67995  ORF Transcript_46082/g.67995 Transcript_46082/m.67995 type:complete len:206 (-) Transcript_46082:79-696(-)